MYLSSNMVKKDITLTEVLSPSLGSVLFVVLLHTKIAGSESCFYKLFLFVDWKLLAIICLDS
jgi:hypothetical protein